jgi:hypothetical protein
MELEIERYGRRYWAVYEDGLLLCVTVYKKGARAVIARIVEGAGKENSTAEVPIRPEPRGSLRSELLA